VCERDGEVGLGFGLADVERHGVVGAIRGLSGVEGAEPHAGLPGGVPDLRRILAGHMLLLGDPGVVDVDAGQSVVE
jgi:hypothetical protein